MNEIQRIDWLVKKFESLFHGEEVPEDVRELERRIIQGNYGKCRMPPCCFRKPEPLTQEELQEPKPNLIPLVVAVLATKQEPLDFDDSEVQLVKVIPEGLAGGKVPKKKEGNMKFLIVSSSGETLASYTDNPEEPGVQYLAACAKAEKMGGCYVMPIKLIKSSDGLANCRGFYPALIHWAAQQRAWRTYKIPVRGEWLQEDETPEWGWYAAGLPADWGSDEVNDPVRREVMEAWLKLRPNVEYAYSKGSSMRVTEIDKLPGDEPGWFHLIKKHLGVEFLVCDKLVKALSQFDRSYPMAVKLASVNLVIVAGPEEENDGFIEISEDLKGMCLRHMEWFGKTLDRKYDWVHDQLWKKCRDSLVYNFRAVVPEGLVKGQAFVNSRLPMRTIRTHACNVKARIQVEDGAPVLIGMDPQPGHDESSLNLQYLVNQPQVFHPGECLDWLVEELEEKEQKLQEGGVLDDIMDLTERIEWGDSYGGIDIRSHTTQIRLKACEAVEVTGSLRTFPHLTTQLATAGTKHLVDVRKFGISFQIPHAVHWQLISDTVMSRLKPGFEVKSGYIRFDQDYKVAVVSGSDYTKVRVDHGGCDMDDFFDLIFRKLESGRVVCIALRSPNDRGEYSVWKIQGPGPVGITSEGMPVIPAERKGVKVQWPMRRSQMGPKPDNLLEKQENPRAGQLYGLEDMLIDLARTTCNPGSYVNAYLLKNLVLAMDEWPMVTMEEAVDTCQQGGTEAEIQWIMMHSQKLVQDICKSGVEIPGDFFYRRKLHKNLEDTKIRANLVECWFNKDTQKWEGHWIDRFFRDAEQILVGFVNSVKDWVQSEVPLIKALAQIKPAPGLKDLVRAMWEEHRGLMGHEDLPRKKGLITKAGWKWLREKRKATIDKLGLPYEEILPTLAQLVHIERMKRYNQVVVNDEILTGPEMWDCWLNFLEASK